MSLADTATQTRQKVEIVPGGIGVAYRAVHSSCMDSVGRAAGMPRYDADREVLLI